MSTSSPLSSAEPLTPERRRQQTRNHLLEAAARVFAERGFHGATMDEVAAAAGFTKGAVYSNFKNKEDLFLALFDLRAEQEFEEVQKALAERSGLADPDATERDVALTSRLIFGSPEFHLLSLEFTLYAARNEDARRKLAERQRAATQTLVDLLQAQVGELGADYELSADDVVTLQLSLFNGIGLRHLIDPETVNDKTIEMAIGFITRALGLDHPPEPD
jgi:AcrR family transcriptional regulator